MGVTVYLKFNVDEHELNNDEEEAAAIMLPRARVADEKASITARVELRPWVCCVSARMGSSFSSGRLGCSAAGQPAPQSRVTSSVGSVGKSKNTVCLLIENDEQIAIACVGMADVNNPIILGISREVLYSSLPKA